MEKILSSINQQNYGTTLTKHYKSICCGKPGGCKKTNFRTLIQKLLKITENYTNQDGEELTFKYLQGFKVAYQ